MRITDLLDKNSINLNASPQNKKEALDQAVELMARSGKKKPKTKKLVCFRLSWLDFSNQLYFYSINWYN